VVDILKFGKTSTINGKISKLTDATGKIESKSLAIDANVTEHEGKMTRPQEGRTGAKRDDPENKSIPLSTS